MDPQSQKIQTNEGKSVDTDYFTIDTPDDELVRMIDKKIVVARKENEARKTEGERNTRYWEADQLKGIPLRWHNSRIVQNRIYIGVETMVPIITANPPEPVVSAALDKEVSKKAAKKLQATLFDKYDTDNQQVIFQMGSRHWLLEKIGVLKIRWVEEIDDFVVEVVHPAKIIFGTSGHLAGDIWTAEFMENTVKELIDMYPERKKDILVQFAPGPVEPTEEQLGTTVGYWEYWSEDGSFVVSKYLDCILQKKLNPYLKWTKDKKFDRKNNHLRSPKKPYIFINSQNTGRYIWDNTTPVSQAIPIQDGINLLYRIITDSAADQGILIGAQEYISIEELRKYTGGPLQKLSVKGSNASQALFRLSPKELQAFVLQLLFHLEDAADNVMGTHSTTRGEKSKNITLGQDVMAKEADYGRIDGFVRAIEKAADELFNWEVQMIKIKYTKEHLVSMLGESDAALMIKFKNSEVENGIKITVKEGSTLPTDKLTQRQEAVDLAKMKSIDPITFFERLDFPNPRETAKRLVMYNKDPLLLFPELIGEIEKQNQKQAEKLGRVNAEGKIIPEISPEANQTTPLNIPSSSAVEPSTAPTSTVPQPNAEIQPTEHTQRLFKGEQVAPFDQVQPSLEHLNAEFAVMSDPSFAKLPQELQDNYAIHVAKEKNILQTQTA